MATREMIAKADRISYVKIVEGRGFKFCSWVPTVQAAKKQTIGAKRGKISGWSRASRRRMREVLLLSVPPAGWVTGGFTFTIPGPVMPAREARDLWIDYCRRIAKIGYGMIWRVEVQARGQLHWHGVAVAPTLDDLDRFRSVWMGKLADLGPVDHTVFLDARRSSSTSLRFSARPRGPSCTLSGLSRAELPGADDVDGKPGHAVRIEHCDLRGSWLRYLQDQASKTKQHQIGENIGRHWGIVGRARWGSILPESNPLTEKQAAYVLRCLQRLATPSFKDGRSPFGRKLGGRIKRGCRGSSVWFTKPEVARRVIQEAIKEFPDDFEGEPVKIESGAEL